MKYLKCTMNEQDAVTENETDMFLELPDNVTDAHMDKMFRAFLLDWYSDGDWEDEERACAWFPTVGKSVTCDIQVIDTKAEWDVLVKYTHNSTVKFLHHLPNREKYLLGYPEGKYSGRYE